MSESALDINEIYALLPHRYPFMLVDRVLEYKLMDSLVAIKNVTMNEPFFQGHFPGNPVMPGVLILEALAQTSGILAKLSLNPPEGYDYLHYLAGVDGAKFKHVVTPGDQMKMKALFIGRKKSFWRMQAESYVEDKLVCSAQFLIVAKEIKKC